MTSITDEIARQHDILEEHQKKLRQQIHGNSLVEPTKKDYRMVMRDGKYVLERQGAAEFI